MKMQKTVNLELTIDELSEIHLTLALRKCQLMNEIDTYKTQSGKDVQLTIAMRQLERISPIVYWIGCMVRESMETENA